VSSGEGMAAPAVVAVKIAGFQEGCPVAIPVSSRTTAGAPSLGGFRLKLFRSFVVTSSSSLKIPQRGWRKLYFVNAIRRLPERIELLGCQPCEEVEPARAR